MKKIMKLIIELLQQTIRTKRNDEKRLNNLAEKLEKANKEIDSLKEEKDSLIDLKNMYKEKYLYEHKKINELEKVHIIEKTKLNDQLKESNKIIKKIEKQQKKETTDDGRIQNKNKIN